MKYVALLRAINVGGNNNISMKNLKACFEKAGFKYVSTYINSGNVVFESNGKDPKLSKKLEDILSKTFKYEAKVVIRSLPEIKKVISSAPKDWAKRTDIRCNILFLKSPLGTKETVKELSPKEVVDFVKTGPEVVYVTTLWDQYTKSGLPKLVLKKVYKSMTIRTFGTTKKIYELMKK